MRRKEEQRLSLPFTDLPTAPVTRERFIEILTTEFEFCEELAADCWDCIPKEKPRPTELEVRANATLLGVEWPRKNNEKARLKHAKLLEGSSSQESAGAGENPET